MRPHITVITLGVDDLERALAFYRDGLGLASQGIVGAEFEGDETRPNGSAAFFPLDGGLQLAIYPRSELAKDAGVAPDAPGVTEFSIGHQVETHDDVDAVLEQARAAGATILGEPHDRPWGIYSGYFKDPDGHLWEVFWNPRTANGG